MLEIQFKKKLYQFKPTWLGLIITLICIPLFIKLGVWQYDKAQQKLHIQMAYQVAEKGHALPFPTNILNVDDKKNVDWKYKLVTLQGAYQPQYQLLLDNQVDGNRAGYHVITPFKMADSDEYVLINRGWIPANNTHTDVPTVKTPSGQQLIVGQVWLPSQQFFSLEKPVEKNVKTLEKVWQNMDLKRYQQAVPMKISALMIKLDAGSQAGGFVRHWEMPVERIATHIGYAFQWFGFAIAAFLIFIVMSFKRVDRASSSI